MRVLIAEDEPVVAEGLRSRLERLGHAVLDIVSDGRSAVARAEAVTPDLVFLDIKMPGMDGLTAAERIMTVRPVPIILLTAHVQPDLIERAMQAGVMGYLVKPVDSKDLLPAITLAIARFVDLMTLRKEAQSLQEALLLRQCVERAKGILALRLGCSEDRAHQQLQRFARHEGITFKEAAAQVLTAEKFFADLEESGPI